MEGIALTGAWVDKEQGLLALIALELGVSSRLVAYLRKGEPVVVMGPTGAPTVIPEHRNVLLLGGGLGNAVLFSIAKGMREAGNRVIYFAGYKKGEDLFKRESIEAATDQVIWSTDTGAEIEPGRPQDAHFRGNIVEAMLAYQRGELGERVVPLNAVDRIIAIGSASMMAAVKAARHGALEPHLKKDHVGIASINSPMQCMMKEVCAQCLQKHVNPVTGEETIVFSCFNQDQEMDCVDFVNLAGAPAAEHGAGEAGQSLARSPIEGPGVRARLNRAVLPALLANLPRCTSATKRTFSSGRGRTRVWVPISKVTNRGKTAIRSPLRIA